MASSRNGGRERKLPEGYVTIKEICEKKIPPGRFVGVIGLVKDRRAPIPVGTRNGKFLYLFSDLIVPFLLANLLSLTCKTGSLLLHFTINLWRTKM